MRFTTEELQETLRKLDLTIRPMTEEAYQECLALLGWYKPMVREAKRGSE